MCCNLERGLESTFAACAARRGGGGRVVREEKCYLVAIEVQ